MAARNIPAIMPQLSFRGSIANLEAEGATAQAGDADELDARTKDAIKLPR
jgi:hypothetical protein